MNEAASPENLQKFLESDDPAMVRKGIAISKEAGVEVTVEGLERFLGSFSIDEVKTGMVLADEAGVGDEAMDRLCNDLRKNLQLDSEKYYELGGIDVVEFCEDSASDLLQGVCNVVHKLGEIGDKRAVEPLLELLDGDIEMLVEDNVRDYYDEYRIYSYPVVAASVRALGQLGDGRALEPLNYTLRAFGNEDETVSRNVKWALSKIGSDAGGGAAHQGARGLGRR